MSPIIACTVSKIWWHNLSDFIFRCNNFTGVFLMEKFINVCQYHLLWPDDTISPNYDTFSIAKTFFVPKIKCDMINVLNKCEDFLHLRITLT